MPAIIHDFVTGRCRIAPDIPASPVPPDPVGWVNEPGISLPASHSAPHPVVRAGDRLLRRDQIFDGMPIRGRIGRTHFDRGAIVFPSPVNNPSYLHTHRAPNISYEHPDRVYLCQDVKGGIFNADCFGLQEGLAGFRNGWHVMIDGNDNIVPLCENRAAGMDFDIFALGDWYGDATSPASRSPVQDPTKPIRYMRVLNSGVRVCGTLGGVPFTDGVVICRRDEGCRCLYVLQNAASRGSKYPQLASRWPATCRTASGPHVWMIPADKDTEVLYLSPGTELFLQP